MCARLNTPPAPPATERAPTETVGGRGFEGGVGVPAAGNASPQNLQTVATALLRLPYPALDHFHRYGGPAKTLDRQQLRVRKGTRWTLFRKKTTSRGRYILLTPQVEDVYLPLIYKTGNHTRGAAY